MGESTTIELQVWPSDYGLVSINSECIRQALYLTFANVPFKLKHHTNPVSNATGDYPVLKDDDLKFNKYSEAVEHLRFKRYSLDFGLSTKSCSEMMAFTSMVVRMLEPVVEFTFWLDRRNYEEFTRVWYAKVMPSLFSTIYLRRRKGKAGQIIEAYYRNLEDPKVLQDFIKNLAADCCGMLSNRLGESQFFYGASPSSLDCTVYAFLAPLIKIPLPSNDIGNIVMSNTNLVNFVKRVDDKYFPGAINEPVFIKKEVVRVEDPTASTTMKICTIAFVACALFGYAVTNKLIEFPKLY